MSEHNFHFIERHYHLQAHNITPSPSTSTPPKFPTATTAEPLFLPLFFIVLLVLADIAYDIFYAEPVATPTAEETAAEEAKQEEERRREEKDRARRALRLHLLERQVAIIERRVERKEQILESLERKLYWVERRLEWVERKLERMEKEREERTAVLGEAQREMEMEGAQGMSVGLQEEWYDARRISSFFGGWNDGWGFVMLVLVLLWIQFLTRGITDEDFF